MAHTSSTASKVPGSGKEKIPKWELFFSRVLFPKSFIFLCLIMWEIRYLAWLYYFCALHPQPNDNVDIKMYALVNHDDDDDDDNDNDK